MSTVPAPNPHVPANQSATVFGGQGENQLRDRLKRLYSTLDDLGAARRDTTDRPTIELLNTARDKALADLKDTALALADCKAAKGSTQAEGGFEKAERLAREYMLLKLDYDLLNLKLTKITGPGAEGLRAARNVLVERMQQAGAEFLAAAAQAQGDKAGILKACYASGGVIDTTFRHSSEMR